MAHSTISSLGYIRCAIYARFSTNMQRVASLEDQIRSCREKAAAKGWHVLDEHIYKDAGISGATRANRPGLKQLEAEVKRFPRPFDYVLIDDTSRLARNLGDMLKISEMFTHHGVEMFFVQQNFDSASGEDFNIVLSLVGLSDEQASRRIRARSREGVKGRVLAGYCGGSYPYGYRGVKEAG